MPESGTPGQSPGRPKGEVRLRTRTVHGYRRAFRMAGQGSAVLLIHGIGDSSVTWNPVIRGLAPHYRVIAPDLLGHGASDKPRGDYSVGAYANGMRDLLSVLGIERVTLVGHSLGGAVAMQFAYQFPERTERLVLVGTGGVGREVTPLLRAASLPGAEFVLSALRLPTVRYQVSLLVRLLQKLDTGLGLDAPDLIRTVDALPDAAARNAFIRTLRAVVDSRGQVGTLLDRCYLTEGMPTMLVWGERDQVVPSIHAGIAHVSMPGSRLELFENAGHFPFHSDPQRFVSVVHDFISTTEPAGYRPEQWRMMLRGHQPNPRAQRLADILMRSA
ncbi:alpha/beta fold hydrolase [Streptacidiphilus jiangxiensis]|uniref:Pimeloyl-ACP methyl ester carboxylesterase n=1 Tax=Streptacidiphilus jiangxiensis TaxID=235985 RepID=A0A1H7IA27_STRJI|nr:alpha/beta hydrolase [Streptacidiphilus jiangxiensis]SEK59401.1 Pimeloyl-ACP methyl ester carboxylesterase [Streptacidiphilus jiangxiensis]